MRFVLLLACLSVFWSVSIVNAQDISQYTVGEYTVYVLPENNMTGNTGILKGVSEQDINKYFSEKNFTMYLNTMLIKGPKHTILVDAGFGNKLFTHLENLKIAPEDIDTILLTHMHGDHVGGLLKDGKVAFPKATLWLAKQEKSYWTDTKIQNSLPKEKQQGFINGQKILAAYADKVRTFEPKKLDSGKTMLMDGIQVIAAFGHTPGHTAISVGEGADSILIWADLVHVESIQMPMPKTAVVFDVDSEMAIATRIKMLDYIEKNKLKVVGMHLQGGAAMLKKQGAGYELIRVK